MTTTAVTTAAGPILAIDLGKYKCVACVYCSAADHAFRGIDTSLAEVERLIRRTRPAVAVIEACSLAGWVHDLCASLQIPCRVANTGAEAWKYKHAKRKPDRDDALRLAQLYALGQLPEVAVPAKPVREWRALIAHRQALVTHRVAAQNRIRSILVGQGLPAPRGATRPKPSGSAGSIRSAPDRYAASVNTPKSIRRRMSGGSSWFAPKYRRRMTWRTCWSSGQARWAGPARPKLPPRTRERRPDSSSASCSLSPAFWRAISSTPIARVPCPRPDVDRATWPSLTPSSLPPAPPIVIIPT